MRGAVRRSAAVMTCTVAALASVGGGSAIAKHRPTPPPPDPVLTPIGSYATGLGEASGETSDLERGLLFVTNSANNSLDVVNAANPKAPTLIKRVDLSPYGAGPNSVDADGDLVAIAVEASPKTSPGVVVLLRRDGSFVAKATVGALPDMLTFTPDGKQIVVANEGEPSSYGQPDSVDPEGSVSIVDVKRLLRGKPDAVRTVDFTAFDAGGRRHDELPASIRLNGPNASVAQDLEPEYVAFDPSDDDRAVVTLQEANAVALVDLDDARVRKIVSLGSKDHSLAGAGLDASDRDTAIAIAPWPVEGLPMPDAIASFQIGRETYYVTANEGDARDYTGFLDEARVSALTLDPIAFPNAAALKANGALGRLNVSATDGVGPNGFTSLFSYGTRSATIWDSKGRQVADTGDMFEQAIAAAQPAAFNADNTASTFDNRSDNKGPEPEGATTGVINGRTYAFVGLERQGGFVVIDVTNPAAPRFVQWANNRDYALPAGPDSGPEVLEFVAARRSADNRRPLVVVSNEISGTVTFYEAS